MNMIKTSCKGAGSYEMTLECIDCKMSELILDIKAILASVVFEM